ncbi:SusC/RagA family TonB-linked outer membrane protein [Mucilaginibacter sp. BJC16-A38]|uniref:SusC/RagA family TonB-linked outer membrane protein n=1 Tax=Mucilaginibacter phenanthrenivorans TaxID=1234842 RepID=UPI0021582305|nr:SusC/RagA family TonB-linked outer membrane protein [Mucilaginibacter phenanthrenivorans]MCR8556990.1 SusC/RagA family TonB-linked outer membrane protein [Mucilaginibacter phenanthrenivorans]
MQLNHRFKMQPQARFIPRKLLLVMKLTVFLLTITFLQVSANVFSQKINLKEKNVSIDKVLSQIQDQSGYEFFYNASALKQAGTVTINLKDATVQDALDELFRNKPFSYSLDNNTITIKEKPTNFLDKIKDKVKEFMAATDVTGRVMDENNQPLSGATVTVKGTNNATNSDLNGFFTLKNVQANDVIVITFIGYDKKEVPAAPNLGAIKLSQASSKLDEVQVIAYGTQSQRLSVNNVVTVGAKEISQQNVNNPLLALQGRVPGLNINQTTGMAGGGVKVQLGGQNSIRQSNSLLYVVDGIPYPSDVLSNTSISGPLHLQNNYASNLMSYINPDDIESISILKDADATSIYGSRAANGAIIITTKKGKEGDMKVNLSVNQGWGSVAHFLPLLNTQQYLQMRHEAFKNDGATPQSYDDDVNGVWDTTRNTNWQKTLIGKTAQYADYNVNVSGGNSLTQYIIGSTFHRETSVFPGDFSDQKGSFHFNVATSSANRKFKINLTANYVFDNNLLPNQDLAGQAVNLPPDAPALYNGDGTLNWQPDANGPYSWSNPLQYLYATYQNRSYNLITNMVLSYNILPKLVFKTNLGYNNLQYNQLTKTLAEFVDPVDRTPFSRGMFMTTNSNTSWIVEPQLNYNAKIAAGTLDLIVGATINQVHSDGFYIGGTGFSSDALVGNLAAASSIGNRATVQSLYKYNALFGRANYNLANQFLLSISVRRDGSSRFGEANKLHDFWSAGAGWIFTEQKSLKNHLSFLSFGKIKANYGTTGNDGIGDYQYLNLYNSLTFPVNYQGVAGLRTTSLPNPYLQWELTKKLLVGLDLGFLKDRITLSADLAYNRSSNQLVGYNLPYLTGFGLVTENWPATVQNVSWEGAIHTDNIKNKDFSWTTNINFTVPHNKLVAYQGTLPVNLFIGYPLGTIKGYHYLGVDPATGIYTFADSHGNPTANPNYTTDANTLISPAFPKFYGGLGNNFTYKRFSLDVFLQFAKQVAPTYAFGTSDPGTYGQQPTYVLSRWQSPGNISTVQKFNSDYSLANNLGLLGSSDAYYADASYVRVKNVAFSYQLPENTLHQVHIRTARIFLQAQNLVTITKFKGMDPETGTGVLPPLKVITIGCNVGF